VLNAAAIAWRTAGMDEDGPTARSTNEETTEADEAGFRRAGRRALTPAERRVVRGRARWLRAKFAAVVVAFWLVLFFALGTGVFIEEAQGVVRLVSILVTALLFVGRSLSSWRRVLFLGDSRRWAATPGGAMSSDSLVRSRQRNLARRGCKLCWPPIC